MKNGVEFTPGQQMAVHSRYIVCDAPARAMVKAIKLYSGYAGCDKCCQNGTWSGRMTYPKTSCELRTDATFRIQHQEKHHRETSPLCDLKIDMVKHFPIDFMHQCCLGVMKKLILTWIRGVRTIKLSAIAIGRINM